MCVFCSIISGEIPTNKVLEDDNFLAFYDISGATKGHTLVVPKKHFDNIYELDEETSMNILIFVKKVIDILKKDESIKGFNILNNNGVIAGQTINHFHIHVIPRYEDDGVELKFIKK